jgi:N-acetyl-gamma-glutamyl-phosphate reductase
MHRIPVGVLGASGYAGRELCRLLAQHPQLELAFATANEQRGQKLHCEGRTLTLLGTEEAPLGAAALVFSALPHGASREWVLRAREAGAKAIDLSSDLRPGNNGNGQNIPYGLPELFREALRGASTIANPGCYPTAVLLGLAPLLARGLVVPASTVVIDAASGVTGAGNNPRRDLLFAEVVENFRPYAAGNEHRHLPEMRAAVASYGADVDLLFTAHLLPVARGILATCTVRILEQLDAPNELWRAHYAAEPFVEISDELPSLRDVIGRNVARISVRRVSAVRQPTLQVFSAIDNLVKGAAGQALQNANLALGLLESAGLPV